MGLFMKKIALVYGLQAMGRLCADGCKLEGTVVIAGGGGGGTITASVLAKDFVHIVAV